MRTFFISIKNWLVNHAPTRRRIIQLYAFLLYNANSKGFINGEIFKGNSKYLCVPGLNCYSCPGAVAACPLGALQNAINASGTKTSYYVFGIIALFGLILGRTICGFLCPVGLGQELLYKIKTPKIRKSRYTRALSYLKYVILVVLVVAVPLLYALKFTPMPGFCKYICPAGTFEGGIALLLNPNNRGMLDLLGPIFTWKFAVLIVIVIFSVFMYRPFCRFLCPLGAIYGFFNRIALLGVSLDKTKCTDCGLCVQHCKMDVKRVGDHECINCGECISVCPAKAITWKGSKVFLRGNDVPQPAAVEPEVDIRTMKFSPLMPSVALAPAVASASVNSAPCASSNSPISSIEPSEADNGASGGIGGSPSAPGEPRRKHDRTFWMRVTAWALAAALLAGMLIYYNVFAGKTQIIYGTEVGNRLLSFDATVYGEDEEFSFSERMEKGDMTLVLFDDTVTKEQMSDLDAAVKSFKADYPDLTENNEVYAIHPSDMDEAFISEMGWDELDIKFGKDAEDGIFVHIEQMTYPVIMTLTADRTISSKLEGNFDQNDVIKNMRTLYTGHEVGKLLPDFAVNIYGKGDNGRVALLDEKYDSFEHLGQVMVVNFWATWCTPCVGELPFFEKIAEEMPEVSFVAIHTTISEDPAKFIQFNKDEDENHKPWSNYTLTFAQDVIENNLAMTYTMLGGKDTMPTTLIIDKRGVITFVRPGQITEAELRTEIERALGN